MRNFSSFLFVGQPATGLILTLPVSFFVVVVIVSDLNF